VSRVVPDDKLIESAFEVANKISSFSKPIVAMAKEAVNKSYESTLREGLMYERRLFQSTFATVRTNIN
jgi:enoyl-CoA hydratase/carnithine racemase